MSDLSNRNPTNLDSYNEFMRQQQELFNSVNKNVKQKRIEKNIETWTNSLSWPWNQADLKYFTGKPAKVFNNPNSYPLGVQIYSKQGFGKTFYVYALIKEYIKRGIVTPDQIRITDLRTAISNNHGMYEARIWKESFFDKKAKLLVIEGASKELSMMKLRGARSFWYEFFSHAKENGIITIITYTTGEKEIINLAEAQIPVLDPEKGHNFKLSRNAGLYLELNDSTRNKKLERLK